MRHMFAMFLLAALFCNVVHAQPAGMAAAASSTAVVSSGTISANTPFTCTAWTTILSTSFKPAGGKDLFIGFSAQTGLFTAGLVASNNGVTTSTLENTGIEVRVLVDSSSTALTPPPGTLAAPGTLTFDNLIRQTSLTTFSSLADILSLSVQQGGAHSFNFIQRDVGVGVHTVNAQSRFCYQNSASTVINASTLMAVIGPRTLTVDEVKLDAQ